MGSRRTPVRVRPGGSWATAVLIASTGPALAALLLSIDVQAGAAGVFPRLSLTAPAARAVLGAVAGSLAGAAAVTWSLTVVALHLSSPQLTPGVLREVLRARPVQAPAGGLVATVLFCVPPALAARGTFVPSLSVVAAIMLAPVGLVLLVALVHRLARTTRAPHLAAAIAARTRHELRSRPGLASGAAPRGPRGAARSPVPVLLRAERPGFVRGVDVERVARAATRSGDVVRVPVRPGEFVTVGTPVVELVTTVEPTRVQLAGLARTVVVADERDIAGDPAFGVRLLTDIALRAAALGDFGTAVTCAGYLTDILTGLAPRDLPTVHVRAAGADGVTVVVATAGFDLYTAALVEIGRHARDTRVAVAVLEGVNQIATAAARADRKERVAALRDLLRAISGQALEDARSDLDRALLAAVVAEFPVPEEELPDSDVLLRPASEAGRVARTRTVLGTLGLTADRAGRTARDATQGRT